MELVNRSFLSVSAAVSVIALASAPASAHATLEPREAAAGSYYKAVIAVPHGCDGAATISLRVGIPDGVIAVKPMPKPGWRLTTEKGTYARTYAHHGRDVGEGVRSITWQDGRLSDEHFDEFVFQAYLSEELSPGATIYFSVKQICETGSIDWNETADTPAFGSPMKYPAPRLTITEGKSRH